MTQFVVAVACPGRPGDGQKLTQPICFGPLEGRPAKGNRSISIPSPICSIIMRLNAAVARRLKRERVLRLHRPWHLCLRRWKVPRKVAAPLICLFFVLHWETSLPLFHPPTPPRMRITCFPCRDTATAPSQPQTANSTEGESNRLRAALTGPGAVSCVPSLGYVSRGGGMQRQRALARAPGRSRACRVNF